MCVLCSARDKCYTLLGYLIVTCHYSAVVRLRVEVTDREACHDVWSGVMRCQTVLRYFFIVTCQTTCMTGPYLTPILQVMVLAQVEAVAEW